jgi:hypothetical protein
MFYRHSGFPDPYPSCRRKAKGRQTLAIQLAAQKAYISHKKSLFLPSCAKPLVRSYLGNSKKASRRDKAKLIANEVQRFSEISELLFTKDRAPISSGAQLQNGRREQTEREVCMRHNTSS